MPVNARPGDTRPRGRQCDGSAYIRPADALRHYVSRVSPRDPKLVTSPTQGSAKVDESAGDWRMARPVRRSGCLWRKVHGTLGSTTSEDEAERRRRKRRRTCSGDLIEVRLGTGSIVISTTVQSAGRCRGHQGPARSLGHPPWSGPTARPSGGPRPRHEALFRTKLRQRVRDRDRCQLRGPGRTAFAGWRVVSAPPGRPHIRRHHPA